MVHATVSTKSRCLHNAKNNESKLGAFSLSLSRELFFRERTAPLARPSLKSFSSFAYELFIIALTTRRRCVSHTLSVCIRLCVCVSIYPSLSQRPSLLPLFGARLQHAPASRDVSQWYIRLNGPGNCAFNISELLPCKHIKMSAIQACATAATSLRRCIREQLFSSPRARLLSVSFYRTTSLSLSLCRVLFFHSITRWYT